MFKYILCTFKLKNTFPAWRSVKLFLMVLLIAVFAGGCKKSPTEPDPDPITTEKGVENLGCGYDVFEKYADVTIVKARLLDLNKLAEANLIEKKTIEKSVFTTSSGTTVSEYATSLQVQAELTGSYMYFSGAVRASFSQNRYSQQEYSYATVHSIIQKLSFRIPIDVSVSEIKNYLTETASSKLNDVSVSPATLFQTYGTHCMVGIIVGGRLDYNISAKSSDVTGGKSVGAYANYGFKSKFSSASISTETISESQWGTFSNSKEERLETYGGLSEYGQNIINDGDYNNWIQSINDNPVFCEFASNNSLLPIWELCNSETRKTEIRDAYATWANDKKIIQTTTPHSCIIDLQVKTSGNWSSLADVINENGLIYYKLGMDCNAGAGGDYIAIYYALGLDDGSASKLPINSIKFQNHSVGESIPQGYVKASDIDLNKGAGSDYIYLCFKRDTADPIRGLKLHDEDNGSDIFSKDVKTGAVFYDIMRQSNNNIKQDLNQGAGGHYIFMSYSTDYID